MITLPIGLQHALESGECVLFVGAGIGEHLKCPDGRHLPGSGTELAGEIAAHFALGAIKPDLSKVAELIEIRKKRKELELFLQKRLADAEPDEYLRWIPAVRWKAIFTTNYDRGLERSYEVTAEPPNSQRRSA